MAGETHAHRTLKRAALLWAQQHGYSIAAMEVRVPNSNFRADLAAYQPGKGNTAPGLTAVFECKQARPDFLKDRHDLDETLARLRRLNQRRTRLEHRLGIHHPTLRNGDSLFQEFQSLDLSALNHHGYRRVTQEIGLLERRIYGRTKFNRMIRWRCANLFYLVAPRHLLRDDELPAAWGLLSPAGDDDTLELIRKPSLLDLPAPVRLDWLHRIAARGTQLTNREAGIDPGTLIQARRRE